MSGACRKDRDRPLHLFTTRYRDLYPVGVPVRTTKKALAGRSARTVQPLWSSFLAVGRALPGSSSFRPRRNYIGWLDSMERRLAATMPLERSANWVGGSLRQSLATYLEHCGRLALGVTSPIASGFWYAAALHNGATPFDWPGQPNFGRRAAPADGRCKLQFAGAR